MVRYFIVIAVCVLGIIFLGQLHAAYDMLAAVPPQPWFGVGFISLVVVLLGILVGVPLVRFLRLSVVARPPAMPERTEDVRPAHIVQRLKYVDRYLGRMKRNPLLEERAGEFQKAEDRIGDFRGRARSAGTQKLIGEITAFEMETVDRLLEPLDDHVGRTIRTEALGVGVGTAKAPCRSFETWTGSKRTHAVQRAMQFTRDQSKEIASALMSKVGSGAGESVSKAAGSVKDKRKNAWKSRGE